jgi:hypothetical protein
MARRKIRMPQGAPASQLKTNLLKTNLEKHNQFIMLEAHPP